MLGRSKNIWIQQRNHIKKKKKSIETVFYQVNVQAMAAARQKIEIKDEHRCFAPVELQVTDGARQEIDDRCNSPGGGGI